MQSMQSMQSQAKLKVKVNPQVWNKLMFWAHNEKGLEVSGMGVVASQHLSEGNIEVSDIHMLPQANSSVYTEMDDEAMNKYYEECYAKEMAIGEFGCVWLHTHPGNSCQPSSTDETTFKDTFKRHPWALMLILGQSGDMYGRIKSNFPRIEQEVDVVVDWTQWEDNVSPHNWAKDYDENVRERDTAISFPAYQSGYTGLDNSRYKVGATQIKYVLMEECPQGLGSQKGLLKWLKKAKTASKTRDGTATLIALRNQITKNMEVGALYESEVWYLLWLNWWLLKREVETQYSKNWALFVQQEGITIRYHKRGPKMTHVVQNTPPAPTMPEQWKTCNDYRSAFGYGINDDVPKENELMLPVAGREEGGLAGLPCSEEVILDAVAYGQRILSGGETFYQYTGVLHHPRLQRVMRHAEATTILACATLVEPPLELEGA